MVCTDSAMTIKDAANMMQNMNCDSLQHGFRRDRETNRSDVRHFPMLRSEQHGEACLSDLRIRHCYSSGCCRIHKNFSFMNLVREQL